MSTIYDQMLYARYPEPEPPRQPQETPVTIGQTLKTDFDTAVARVHQAISDVEAFGEKRIPEAADFLDTAATNPVVASVLAAVHVPPSTLTAIAATIDELEQRFAALSAHAADVAEAAQAAEPPADVPADEPVDAPPAVPAPFAVAGPVVGGTAR